MRDPIRLQTMIDGFLEEDVGLFDLTSNLLVPAETRGRFDFAARESFVLAGLEPAMLALRRYTPDAAIEILALDGQIMAKGDIICRVAGRALAHQGRGRVRHVGPGRRGERGGRRHPAARQHAPAILREAIVIVAGRCPTEASGGVNLDTIRAIAETGVDFISVGRLTQGALAVDIGLDVHLETAQRR